MNAEVLLRHFDRISEAPDAVRHLRHFVLDLAVRGKLVEQDPTEGGAKQLLQAIRDRDFSPLSMSDSVPFEIPRLWVWVRLGDICSKTGSGSTPRGGKSVYQKKGIPFLRSQNVHDDGLRLEDVAFISPEIHDRMSGTAVSSDDLLLNITGGSIGRCCLVPHSLGKANISQHVAIIRTAIPNSQQYLHCLIRSPYFQSFVLGEQTGAGRGGLPKNRMDNIPIAVPPIREQQRIVAKVDELMALCDRLDKAQQQRTQKRLQLTRASVYRLNSWVRTESQERDHSKLFVTHLHKMTAERLQMQSIRDAILTLAMQGRLLPQHSDDGTAKDLLGQIMAEKRRLGLEDTDGTAVSASDKGQLRELPTSWTWTTVGSLALSLRYGTSQKCSYEANGVPVLRIPNVEAGLINTNDLKFGSLAKTEVEQLKLSKGDILIIRSNGSLGLVGRPALVDGTAVGMCYAGYLVRLRTCFLDPRYLMLALSSKHVRNQIEKPIRTTVGLKNINSRELSALKIPLAPLAEQRRIVAAVERLMDTCGALEEKLTSVGRNSEILLRAVLADAIQGQHDSVAACESADTTDRSMTA